MNNYIYVAVYNGNISSEGYKSIEDAQNFIKSRFSNLVEKTPMLFVNEHGDVYSIREITIK